MIVVPKTRLKLTRASYHLSYTTKKIHCPLANARISNSVAPTKIFVMTGVWYGWFMDWLVCIYIHILYTLLIRPELGPTLRIP